MRSPLVWAGLGAAMLWALAGLVGVHGLQSRPHKAEAEGAAADMQRGILGVERPADTTEQPGADAAREQHEKENLVAQQRMAAAGETAAAVGVIGLFGLLLTVLYARKAWQAASASAAADAHALEIARTQLADARDIGRAQVRAYISIVEGRYCVATDIIDCHIKLRNSGQSVGIVQSVEAVLTGLTSRTTEHGLRVTQEKITSTYALPVAIPAGGEEAIALGWHEGMTEDGFGWLETDAAKRINITVTIVFRDVFGETFTVHGYLRPASPDSKFEAARREAITEGRLYSYNHPKDEKGNGPAA